MTTISSSEWELIENTPSIFEVGFYDNDGTWFFIWERRYPEATYSCLYANGYNEPMVRFHRENRPAGEMTVADFVRNGLPL